MMSGSDPNKVFNTVEDVVRFFCRHLVSLSGWCQTVNSDGTLSEQDQFFSFSGFIISIRGVWNFVTAGHILKPLEERIRNQEVKVKEFLLVDRFGPDTVSQYAIPFDYTNAPKLFMDNEEAGLDFGLIILRQNYCDLLKANGIVPVLEENWKTIPNELADNYVMLGFPKQLIQTITVSDNGIKRMAGSVAPAAVGIKRLNEIPDGVATTKFPRFIGKLADSGYVLEDITGMSGGPIIGFNEEWNRYWIVAIQSRWLGESRITFGCLISVFANLVDEWLAGSEP